MKEIQVGFLMSYDYELLKNSIPLVYKEAGNITIALDQDLRTWTGEHFEVDDEFFSWIRSFDTENKIQLYKDDFYKSNLNPMENEVRERKMLASRMGIGNWIIQIDADEYFVDFKKFTEQLKLKNNYLKDPEKNPIQIAGYYINLYKYTDDGILYVSESRNQKFATNFPGYVTGRNTKKRVVYIPNLVIHECLSRSEEEIRKKFNNWGHSHQVDIEKFLQKWKKVEQTNYNEFEDFFYLEPEKWKRLNYVQGKTISEIKTTINLEELMPSKLHLKSKNFGQWFKFLFK